ncbi:LemA family protein [bacterium]|nr:LemA family protein [bacterium]
MKRGTIILLVVVGILVILAISVVNFFVGTHNSLVALDETVNNAWAEVENNLQRRYDLIPNLVNTVKGFADQEKEVLLGVTEARSRVGGAGSVSERIDAENDLSNALSRLLVVVENYPQLKSDQNFRALQDELAGTENRLAVARKRYNDAVREFNVLTRQFPTNFVANMFGFEAKPFYEAPEAAQEAPTVEF